MLLLHQAAVDVVDDDRPIHRTVSAPSSERRGDDRVDSFTRDGRTDGGERHNALRGGSFELGVGGDGGGVSGVDGGGSSGRGGGVGGVGVGGERGGVGESGVGYRDQLSGVATRAEEAAAAAAAVEELTAMMAEAETTKGDGLTPTVPDLGGPRTDEEMTPVRVNPK